MNTLRISGQFSKSDIHMWTSACLPDIPANFDDEEVK